MGFKILLENNLFESFEKGKIIGDFNQIRNNFAINPNDFIDSEDTLGCKFDSGGLDDNSYEENLAITKFAMIDDKYEPLRDSFSPGYLNMHN